MNLLDKIGYMPKWHGQIQNNRELTKYSINEPLINYIFNVLGISNGFCVEFGAWDGIKNSNTKRLIDSGWSSIQIEPDWFRFQDLKLTYQFNDQVRCINSFIDTTDNLFDNIIGTEKDIDFCSIDIDGLDIDIFDTFEDNLPKLVCIEGGQALYPFNDRIHTVIAQDNIHQSLSYYINVFKKKGYELLCSYQDCFFIQSQYFDRFNVNHSVMDHYLNGILALPRIPFINNQLQKYQITNSIIDTLIDRCSYIHPDAPLLDKANWCDHNSVTIQNTVEEIRYSYATSS